jgi:hypothetical protein
LRLYRPLPLSPEGDRRKRLAGTARFAHDVSRTLPRM